MARDVVDGEIIESRDALAAWFEAGCKPSGPFRVGTEHEKILFYRAGLSPVPYAGETGIGALLERMNARLGWERIEDAGHLIGLYDGDERRGHFARAGRAVRAVGRPARHGARDGRRARAPYRGLQVGRRAVRDLRPLARDEPEMDAGRDPGHAEKPLRHHEALHAEGRDARPRHDVPHRDRSGEPRLPRREGHGGEAPRRACAAAGDHRALRQFALHRRQAERLSLHALGDLARHRCRTAPACCRSPSSRAWGSSAMSTTRSTCRSISSSAARPTSTSPARASATCSQASSRRRPASARRWPTGRTICRRSFPKCGSSAISRCAGPTSGRPTGSSRCRP